MRTILLVAVLAFAASACGKSEREASPQKPRPAQPRKASAAQPLPSPMPEVVRPPMPEVVPPPAETDNAASPPVVPIAPAGPSGKALLCDGRTDRAGNLPGVRLPVEGLFDDQQAITVELWFRPDTLAERKTPPEILLSAHRAGDGRTDSNTDWSVSIRDGRDERLPYFKVRRRADGDCGHVTGSPGSKEALTAGRWYHFAASYERNEEGRLATQTFLDGTRVSSSVGAAADEACVAPLEITLCQGVTPSGLFTRPFVGAMDDIRISRGVRYREAFVPTTPVSDDSTLLLLRFDDGSIFDLGPRRLPSSSTGSLAFVLAGR
jgi:Concanavalin A-like lectin/glucanases superfamily